MPQFTLEKFNPTVAELTTLAEKYRWLKIKDVDDKEWYKLVKDAQLELRDKRVYIVKTLKNFRQEAIDFQKSVLWQEKDLIAIIDETESKLKAERKRIDDEVEIEKRKKLIPERRAILDEKWLDATDDQLSLFTDLEFNRYVLIEEEKKMEIAKFEMEKEKAKLEEDKAKLQREKEDERIRKEASEKAIADTEKRLKQEAVEKDLRRKEDDDRRDKEAKEREDKRIADAKKAKEDAEAKKIADEKEAKDTIERNKKAEADDKLRLEKEAIARQKKIEADKKYQKRLEDNNYNEKEYRIVDNWNKKVMWRLVSEFILN